MSTSDKDTSVNTGNNLNKPDELTLQIAKLLQSSLEMQSSQNNSDNLSIGFQLNGDNYPLWVTLIRKVIGGRGKKAHLTGIPPAPAETEPTYEQWKQGDQTVFTWIIQNIKVSLMNNVSQFPTAKALWDGLATTYGSGMDPIQIYDLHQQANTRKQGQDRKQPNPMKFPEDITTFNRLKQEERLYQFLTGVDDKFDTVRRDLLKQEPAPSVESAYATIRREAARLQILKPTTDGVGEASQGEIGTGLAAKNRTD
ncbi:uncharacterized protein [Arachis hypogaea]|uniref:uncharacterized protein n=1 Tax=Arachis hypogaea TaxID=3818 RepID=UPI003B20CA8F